MVAVETGVDDDKPGDEDVDEDVDEETTGVDVGSNAGVDDNAGVEVGDNIGVDADVDDNTGVDVGTGDATIGVNEAVVVTPNVDDIINIVVVCVVAGQDNLIDVVCAEAVTDQMKKKCLFLHNDFLKS